ncbi:lytic polysaccharide monooxygenase auxiliary activity family 9 protein [Bailinhaonella thermotolerans]|uniref:Chitin-binding protein n=1 Tax=Bailinhaonella thermotolerans TaxID=1070861 RepID=A0A3A4A742_9ACTN|nr:lytic polysaccharide monooxygenase [Bailinhaonella thermotolerans]RJL21723.1 chitin-binding protein [Bailinhaonella thermotolerans]
MNVRRMALVTALVGGSSVLITVATAGGAYAHGSMQNPPSRSWLCYQDRPESPSLAACKAAVATGGKQALYDWHEVNIANAAGRHRSIIPDGRLCSAGRDKYKGLDLARADWPVTRLPASGRHTFTFRATAPHKGSLELYVTKDGYDPAKPLKWSDLEAEPFHVATEPRLANGAYVMEATLPKGKRGRHLIYTIWQRSDSPEAFYACSDVRFGEGGSTGPTAPPAPTPTPAPSPSGPGGGGNGGGHDHGGGHGDHGGGHGGGGHGGGGNGGGPGGGNGGSGGSTDAAAVLRNITAGVGVQPAKARREGLVTVTAVCGGSKVTKVVSPAFAKQTNAAPVPTTAWFPPLMVGAKTRAGRYPVTVHCANGGVARTTLTVTG